MVFCVLTALLYVASLALERWLRSKQRIPGLTRRRERVWDTAAIVFAVIACVADRGVADTDRALFLVLLSAFNDIDYPKVRQSMQPS